MKNLTPLESLFLSGGKDIASNPDVKLTVDEIFFLIGKNFEVYLDDFKELIKKERPEYEFIVEAVNYFKEVSERIGYTFAFDGMEGFWLNDVKRWRQISKHRLKDELSLFAHLMGFDYYKMDYYEFRRRVLEQFKEMCIRPNLLNELNLGGAKQ